MKRLALPALFIAFVVTPFLAQQTLKVDVDLVLINATVTDPDGRYVVGLEPGNFQIFEDKVEQKVEYFSTEDVPLSVGLIFDASGSMQEALGYARDAALTFLQTANAQDEYFLVEFNERPHVTVEMTSADRAPQAGRSGLSRRRLTFDDAAMRPHITPPR